MMENLDGFIFRRNVRQQEADGMCKKKEKKQLNSVPRSTDDIFDFKFIREGKRKTEEAKDGLNVLSKKAKGAREDVEKAEEVLGSTAPSEMEDLESLSNTVIIKEMPKKRQDGQDLHLRLDENSTLDDLIKLCVSQISKTRKTTYTVNLESAFQQNKEIVRRRNIEKEIEEAQKKMCWAKGEEEKWIRLKEEVLHSNSIRVRETVRANRDFNTEERMALVRKSFLEKADKLDFLKESARFSIAHIREQSEDLLKKIFDIVCKEKEVDTFFLLKALSKVGK